MTNLIKQLIGIAVIALSSSTFTSIAHGILITNLEDNTNGGGFFGAVSFENNGTNTVTVTADISDPINPGLTKGDILGLWFNFASFPALSGQPTFSGSTPILDYYFSENAVGSSLGGNINLNGAAASYWDLAVSVGKNGKPGGFVQTLSFNIILAGLDESQFGNQQVGMRVQSIAGLTNFNSGSSKLLGTNIPLSANTVSVSEPGSLSLCALSLIALAAVRRKRSTQPSTGKNSHPNATSFNLKR